MHRCVFIVQNVSVCWNSWVMRPVTTVMTPASLKIIGDVKRRKSISTKWMRESVNGMEHYQKGVMAEVVVRVLTLLRQRANAAAVQLMLKQVSLQLWMQCCLLFLLAMLKWSQNHSKHTLLHKLVHSEMVCYHEKHIDFKSKSTIATYWYFESMLFVLDYSLVTR